MNFIKMYWSIKIYWDVIDFIFGNKNYLLGWGTPLHHGAKMNPPYEILFLPPKIYLAFCIFFKLTSFKSWTFYTRLGVKPLDARGAAASIAKSSKVFCWFVKNCLGGATPK